MSRGSAAAIRTPRPDAAGPADRPFDVRAVQQLVHRGRHSGSARSTSPARAGRRRRRARAARLHRGAQLTAGLLQVREPGPVAAAGSSRATAAKPAAGLLGAGGQPGASPPARRGGEQHERDRAAGVRRVQRIRGRRPGRGRCRWLPRRAASTRRSRCRTAFPPPMTCSPRTSCGESPMTQSTTHRGHGALVLSPRRQSSRSAETPVPVCGRLGRPSPGPGPARWCGRPSRTNRHRSRLMPVVSPSPAPPARSRSPRPPQAAPAVSDLTRPPRCRTHGAGRPFYDAGTTGAPGTVLRTRRPPSRWPACCRSPPPPLYTSTTATGEPEVVSGTVFTPVWAATRAPCSPSRGYPGPGPAVRTEQAVRRRHRVRDRLRRGRAGPGLHGRRPTTTATWTAARRPTRRARPWRTPSSTWPRRLRRPRCAQHRRRPGPAAGLLPGRRRCGLGRVARPGVRPRPAPAGRSGRRGAGRPRRPRPQPGRRARPPTSACSASSAWMPPTPTRSGWTSG